MPFETNNHTNHSANGGAQVGLERTQLFGSFLKWRHTLLLVFLFASVGTRTRSDICTPCRLSFKRIPIRARRPQLGESHREVRGPWDFFPGKDAPQFTG